MNMNHLKEAIDKMPAVDGLRISDGGRSPLSQATDSSVTVRYQDQTHKYRVSVRSDLTTTAVNLLAARLTPEERDGILVYAPYIGPSCAEKLRRSGIRFIDEAGHVFLQQGSLYLYVTGTNRPDEGARRPGLPDVRAFKTATLKFLYGLLTDPHLDDNPGAALINQPFRLISERTGLALGSVSNVMDDLVAGNFVTESSSGRRLLLNRRKLFERWIQDYGTRLRPRLVHGHFRPPQLRWWKDADVQSWGGRWGGEIAGAKLTGHLVPETATIYALNLPDDFIVRHDLRKDPAGSVEILRPFWKTLPAGDPSDCANPLVVYADLAASEIDRNLETAKRIYEKHLRKTIESA